MSFAQMYNAEVIDQEEMLAKTRRFILELRKRCNPLQVYLFGSLSTKNFKLGSDIDLLLIFKTAENIRESRKSLTGMSRLISGIPTDLLFMTEEDFETKKDSGGIPFIAFREGILL